jgi:hypothetical protein
MTQRTSLEQFRLPLALGAGFLALLLFALMPRAGSEQARATPSPSASVVAGQPGGGVVAESPLTSPGTSPAVSPSPATSPTATPTAASDFRAQVRVCRSISNFRCNDEFDRLPRNATTFVALVEFVDARPGDVLVVAVTGPGGTTASDPYTLQGGGEGAYYSTFSASGLPAGSYTVAASHNGAEVATTAFEKTVD